MESKLDLEIGVTSFLLVSLHLLQDCGDTGAFAIGSIDLVNGLIGIFTGSNMGTNNRPKAVAPAVGVLVDTTTLRLGKVTGWLVATKAVGPLSPKVMERLGLGTQRGTQN